MLSSATLTRKTPLPFSSLGFFGNRTSNFNRRRTLTEAGSSRALSFGYNNGSVNCGRVNFSGRSRTGFGHPVRVSSVSGESSGDSGGIGGSGGGGGGDNSGGGSEGSGGNGGKWSFLSW